MRTSNKANLINKQFGRLTVISISEKKNSYDKSRYWNCSCKCGNLCIRSTGSLTRKRLVISCGCYTKERIVNKENREKSYLARALPEGEAAFNNIYYNYKRGASKRNLEFNVDEKDFRILITSNCYYCGEIPLTIRKMTHCTPFTYNGIDRVDNKLGYTMENCVTCCKLCNNMKHALNKDQFLEHIKKINNHIID